DAAGRFWIGTTHGLDRFDLETGRVTRYVPPGASAVYREEERTVTALFQASDGGIWIGTRIALHRFDPETESFRTFIHEASNPAIVINWIRWIYEHPRKTGTLWIGGVGLARLDMRSGDVRRYTTRDGLPNNTIY